MTASLATETDNASAGQPQHTTEQDFQHFLSYSGLWREPPETIAKLRQAFEAGCDDKQG